MILDEAAILHNRSKFRNKICEIKLTFCMTRGVIMLLMRHLILLSVSICVGIHGRRSHVTLVACCSNRVFLSDVTHWLLIAFIKSRRLMTYIQVSYSDSTSRALTEANMDNAGVTR